MDKKTIEAAHAYYTAKVRIAPETRARGPVIDAHHAIQAFEAGAEWQREQDGGRTTLERELRRLGVDPDTVLRPATDDAVMRMLGSIENRLMELANSLVCIETAVGSEAIEIISKIEAVLDQVTREEPENHPAPETEGEKLANDLMAYGSAFSMDGKRLDPRDVFLRVPPSEVPGYVHLWNDAMAEKEGTFGGGFAKAVREHYEKTGVLTGDSAPNHRINTGAAPIGSAQMRITEPATEGENLTSFTPIEEVVRLHRQHYGKTGGKVEGHSFYFDGDLNIGSAQSRASKPVTDESGVSVGAGAGPMKDERDARIKELEADRDDWHRAYDRLLSNMVHGSVLHVGVDLAGPGADQTAITTHHNIDWKADCLKACDEAGSHKARAEALTKQLEELGELYKNRCDDLHRLRHRIINKYLA